MPSFLIKIILSLLLIVGVYVGLSFSGFLPGNLNIFKRNEVQFVESALKVEEVKAIAKLFTQQYINEFIVEKVHKTPGFIYGFTEDRLIMIASGTCYAGTDLSQLKQEDIKIIDSSTVEISIPKAKILESIINPSGFKIFFSEGFWEKNYNAVQKEKSEAVKALEKMASQSDILRKADIKAVSIMEKFMQSVGFENVKVIVQ
ncbi:MAG: DUF4230 domain-containing protein [Flavobacteriia bacterium]|nr:DUF4230 domain-containing protein [Flavobacteriia bacterium]